MKSLPETVLWSPQAKIWSVRGYVEDLAIDHYEQQCYRMRSEVWRTTSDHYYLVV
jgi:hypothetical protein